MMEGKTTSMFQSVCRVDEGKNGRFSLSRPDLIKSSREPNRLLLGDINGLSRRIRWLR